MKDDLIDPIEDLVGDLFVDRHDELRMCREWIENIPRRHLNSFAFVGRRRTGKTAILVKFFNELFHTQDRFSLHLHATWSERRPYRIMTLHGSTSGAT